MSALSLPNTLNFSQMPAIAGRVFPFRPAFASRGLSRRLSPAASQSRRFRLFTFRRGLFTKNPVQRPPGLSRRFAVPPLRPSPAA